MILQDTFESSSSSAKYTAQYNTETGKGTCNCPGWTKRSVRECKHTKALSIGVDKRQEDAPKFGVHQMPDPFLGFREPPKVKPMLASAMPEGNSISDYETDEWVMEEKYDGHRLLIVVGDDSTVSAWSRPGHDRPAAQRTLPERMGVELAELPPGLYDGELYIHGGTSSDVVRLDMVDELRLALFDVIVCRGVNLKDEPLEMRRGVLEMLQLPSFTRVHVAGQFPVRKSTLDSIWIMGGEGVIVKRRTSLYESGWRTPHWVKVKKLDSAEFTIIGFDEGKSGPCSVFKLRHDDGRETSCKVLTNELLALVHKDPKKYIGRRAVVSHMGFTKSGLWRHPVFDHFVD